MARVTVEDCIKLVPNRFELILVGTARARQLAAGQGHSISVERENDRNPVVALREIAEDKVSIDEMKQKIIASNFRHASVEEDGADNADMSEEEMIRQLEAESGEGDDLAIIRDFDDDDIGARGLDDDDDELIGAPKSAAPLEDEIIGDEIGKAADVDFTPLESMEEDDDEMTPLEIDDEMIGEAIETADGDPEE